MIFLKKSKFSTNFILLEQEFRNFFIMKLQIRSLKQNFLPCFFGQCGFSKWCFEIFRHLPSYLHPIQFLRAPSSHHQLETYFNPSIPIFIPEYIFFWPPYYAQIGICHLKLYHNIAKLTHCTYAMFLDFFHG